MINGVLYGGGTKVDSVAGMSERGKTRRVQARATSQVEDTGGLPIQDKAMDPIYMFLDDGRATAGGIMLLGKVLFEHAPAEVGVVPGDFFTLGPGFWFQVSEENI